MGAADEVVEVAHKALITTAGSGRGEVRCRPTVQAREFIKLFGLEHFQPGAIRALNKLGKPGPAAPVPVLWPNVRISAVLHDCWPLPERLTMHDERVNLHVPEQVEVSYELAGLGSRFLAAMIDAIILTVVIALLAVAAWVIRGYLTGNAMVSGATAWIVLGASTLLGIAYNVYYEVAREGKTPGKAATGLRVISTDGGAVNFEQSTVRNILRIVDALPVLYGVGVVSLLATAKNQRLGDLVAGTMIIKERLDVLEDVPPPPDERSTTTSTEALPSDVSEDVLRAVRAGAGTITREEEKTIRRFLERRYDLGPEARRRLATRLADGLRQRFPGLDAGRLPNPEAFLEVVIRAIDQRR